MRISKTDNAYRAEYLSLMVRGILVTICAGDAGRVATLGRSWIESTGRSIYASGTHTKSCAPTKFLFKTPRVYDAKRVQFVNLIVFAKQGTLADQSKEELQGRVL